MGTKRFRGKPCAYCTANPATTGDHIFAREFFLPDARANLPQVPACEACNNLKSQLEHYLTALLPFGGRHADASVNLNDHVPPRLQRNQKLYKELDAGRGNAWAFENDTWQQTMSLPFDAKRAAQFFALVGRGLALHHFDLYLNEGQASGSIFPSAKLSAMYDHLFQHPESNPIHHALGNDTVTYTGLIRMRPRLETVWRLRFYGGLMLADSTDKDSASSSEIIVVTGNQDLVKKLVEM
ncbi:HNH endonuclease [Methylophilus medardicus]|uniref:HNH endonuclease n=1 Tax=Methylophilus medardicus TaxID=2588534 RepID=A0A5B8CUN3_9PROT|nr:HNH endonuclease [Methylophilus medardicus]QDC44766.1 HNH endonuclease [Methylophilus medardicus]QDC49773.1 HNH endonuclease [Methylophilus medardicus]QDC53478.1 HNH endonuclease [Methylophilus medardicus]